MTAREVARAGKTSAVFFEGNSPYILITFSDAGLSKQFEPLKYWGKRYTEKNNVSVLGIVSDGATWFPPNEMAQIASDTAQLIHSFSTRVSYGFSMGGYGALKFSKLFGASHVIAVAPQFSIDPDDMSGLDKRFNRSFNGSGGRAITASDLSGETWLLYDPYFSPDKINVTHIKEIAQGAKDLIFPFIQHNVMSAIARSHIVTPLIKAVIDSDESAARAIVRKHRRDPQGYYYMLAWSGLNKHPEKTLKVLSDSSTVRAIGQLGYWHLRISGLLRIGRIDAATRVAANFFSSYNKSYTLYHRRVVDEFIEKNLPQPAFDLFSISRSFPENKYWLFTYNRLRNWAIRLGKSGKLASDSPISVWAHGARTDATARARWL